MRLLLMVCSVATFDSVYAFQTTLSTVAAGRAAFVARLRTIATRLEGLPLDAAAEVLVLVEPALRSLEQQAALALERAPAVSG